MRLIDADVLITPLKEEYKKVKQAFDETSVFQAPNDVALYGALMQEVGAVIHDIESQPTVDAVPVRHGKWIHEVRYTIDSLHSYQQYRCSECNMTYITNTKYCPNCGARMDEE